MVLVGCRKSPEAPAEISDLTRFLVRELQTEEADVLGAGLDSLDAHLRTVDMDGSIVDDRSWSVSNLSDEDLGDYAHPGRDLNDLISIGVVGAELHPIENHAEYMMWPVQDNINNGVVYYHRNFPETEDGSCFVDRSCESILTFNESVRDNALYEVYLEVWKSWHWVDFGDGRQAVVAFAWFEESWPTTDGKDATLWQNFELDVWMDKPNPSDGIWRYYVSWTENDVADSEDIVAGTIRGAAETRYEDEEKAAGGEITME